jgi:hypothetical protein
MPDYDDYGDPPEEYDDDGQYYDEGGGGQDLSEASLSRSLLALARGSGGNPASKFDIELPRNDIRPKGWASLGEQLLAGKDTAPSASLHSRVKFGSIEDRMHFGPGPVYDSTSSVSKQSLSANRTMPIWEWKEDVGGELSRFGKPGVKPNDNLGPGEYMGLQNAAGGGHRRFMGDAPAAAFASRQKFGDFMFGDFTGAGPGMCRGDTFFGPKAALNQKKAPSFSMAGRIGKRCEETPGPGAYSHDYHQLAHKIGFQTHGGGGSCATGPDATFYDRASGSVTRETAEQGAGAANASGDLGGQSLGGGGGRMSRSRSASAAASVGGSKHRGGSSSSSSSSTSQEAMPGPKLAGDSFNLSFWDGVHRRTLAGQQGAGAPGAAKIAAANAARKSAAQSSVGTRTNLHTAARQRNRHALSVQRGDRELPLGPAGPGPSRCAMHESNGRQVLSTRKTAGKFTLRPHHHPRAQVKTIVDIAQYLHYPGPGQYG